jgi:hypothetical protein
MGIEIFSDMINALKEIVKLADIPEKEREYYRRVEGDTFTVLYSAISLVQNRLGRLLQIDDQDVFIRELRGLDNLDEWINIERDVRLCDKMDAAGREMQGLSRKIKGRIAIQSWRDFTLFTARVIGHEETLANFINDSLSHLARMSDAAARSSTGYERARDAVRETRDAVDKERRILMLIEREFRRNLYHRNGR